MKRSDPIPGRSHQCPRTGHSSFHDRTQRLLDTEILLVKIPIPCSPIAKVDNSFSPLHNGPRKVNRSRYLSGQVQVHCHPSSQIDVLLGKRFERESHTFVLPSVKAFLCQLKTLLCVLTLGIQNCSDCQLEVTL